MRVVSVPCLKDNYAYLVICEGTNKAAVVDPSEAKPVLAAVESEGVELIAIWNTHHHWDHTGGNRDLLEALPELEVIAHESDKGRVPGQTTFAEEGDTAAVGDVSAAIIHNPGHTSGAISYHVADHRAVFTGDTLFLAGCGRLFEGTPAQMHTSLQKLAALPDDTNVYCGHEYTANNLRFAAAVEPNSDAIATRAAEVATRREAGAPTVPAPLSIERATNPFLRVSDPDVVAAAKNHGAGGDDAAAVFAAIRAWKDSF